MPRACYAREGAPSYLRPDAGAPLSTALTNDVGELNDRERELSRISKLYAALSAINQAIVRTTTHDQLFHHVCRALGEQGGFRMIWIGWNDPVTHTLVPVAKFGDTGGYLQNVHIVTDERREGHGPSGTAFREGRSYICNDMLADPSTLPWRSEIERCGFRASAVFPIREGGVVKGTLTVYAGEPGYFRAEEIALLERAAEDVSFGIDNLAREDARRELEQAKQHERGFSDALLSSLPGVVYVYDRNGKFLRWNRNFERVTGYTSAEIATMHPLDFFTGAQREFVGSRIAEVFEAGASTAEAGFVAKDGTVTPYQFTGVVAEFDGLTCLVGVGIDVTARERAEAARHASEERYRTLFQHAPDGIVIADASSYYLDANESICRMLGYTREELIGLHASDIVVPAEVSHIAPALTTIQAKDAYHREWKFRRKDGSTFSAEVIATVMPDGNLLGMIRDVTQRKQAELALRELNETLESKVAARTDELRAAVLRAEAADRTKSAFLATMSHELRTPLNSIIGFTGIVLQGLAGPLTPEQTKQLAMVRTSGRHLLELINDVLDLSKIEADQLEVRAERFDLRASIERVVSLVQPQLDKKALTLDVVIAPAVGELVSDRRRVEQILLNLVQNAVKFTETGSVTLTATVDEGPRSMVRVSVRDTGIGIAAADLATLFQPFRQIDSGLARQHEGTGLGLAICRRLTTLLDGEISAQSEPGKGSEFTVTLPLQRGTP